MLRSNRRRLNRSSLPNSRHTNRRRQIASDTGETLFTIVVSMFTGAIVIASMALLISWTSKMFGSSEGVGIIETSRPERAVSRELIRSGNRMLVTRKCTNPVKEPNVNKCVELDRTLKFPVPLAVPDWYLDTQRSFIRTNNDSYPESNEDNVGKINLNTPPVCWMITREKQYKRPTYGSHDLNDANADIYDSRDLECWYLVLTKAAQANTTPQTPPIHELRTGFHHPMSMPQSKFDEESKKDSPTWDEANFKSKDLLMPSTWGNDTPTLYWRDEPYKTVYIADRIVSVNSDDPPSTDPSEHKTKSWKCMIEETGTIDEDNSPFTESVCMQNPSLSTNQHISTVNSTVNADSSTGVLMLQGEICVAYTESDIKSQSTTTEDAAKGCYDTTIRVSPGKE